MTAWVIFSDLDETLLDRETYSFEPAERALDRVRRRAIPLVFCTSKTAAETLHFQRLARVDAPFIVENGGGIHVPRGYFPNLAAGMDRGKHRVLALGLPWKKVVEGLNHLKEATAGSIMGFSDMTAEHLAKESGLPVDLARLAKQREFDEPFRFLRREAEFSPILPRLAAERGLRVSKGGRYYHVHGDTTKGRAVTLLQSFFAAGTIRTIGIGDSELDLPMLAAVDVAIAVQRRDGTHDAALVAGIPNLIRAEAPGPAGWHIGVSRVLGEN